jgi:hypothetical protein
MAKLTQKLGIPGVLTTRTPAADLSADYREIRGTVLNLYNSSAPWRGT